MAFPFLEENTASRRRLETLVRRLSDEDLARATPSGWSIAALLAHLAFWDQRVLALLRRWKAEDIDSSPIDADAVNDALKPLCLALDPRTAIELCVSSAAAVDAELETLTADRVEQIEEQIAANPFQFRFSRALHRNAHLNDIERLLQSSQDVGDI
ncbi:MAG TPA: DinB family protein [Anaerolineae bacterium]|nr:DinB family protein [Anaerolineae bacterium]